MLHEIRLSVPRVRLYAHARAFNGPFSGTTRVNRYQNGKPIRISLKHETVNGSGISWAVYSFYRPDALPAAQTTVSKH